MYVAILLPTTVVAKSLFTPPPFSGLSLHHPRFFHKSSFVKVCRIEILELAKLFISINSFLGNHMADVKLFSNYMEQEVLTKQGHSLSGALRAKRLDMVSGKFGAS